MMPTQAAMRTAAYLFDTGRCARPFGVDEVAGVIDDQSGLFALLEACRAALPAMEAHEDTGCDCPDSEAARLLRAAIAKAEG